MRIWPFPVVLRGIVAPSARNPIVTGKGTEPALVFDDGVFDSYGRENEHE
jgi:hypothetical protein